MLEVGLTPFSSSSSDMVLSPKMWKVIIASNNKVFNYKAKCSLEKIYLTRQITPSIDYIFPFSLTLTYKTWWLTRWKLFSDTFLEKNQTIGWDGFGDGLEEPFYWTKPAIFNDNLFTAAWSTFVCSKKTLYCNSKARLIFIRWRRCSHRTIKELLEVVILKEDIDGSIYSKVQSLYEKPCSVDYDGYDLVHTRRVGVCSNSLNDDFRKHGLYMNYRKELMSVNISMYYENKPMYLWLGNIFHAFEAAMALL